MTLRHRVLPHRAHLRQVRPARHELTVAQAVVRIVADDARAGVERWNRDGNVFVGVVDQILRGVLGGRQFVVVGDAEASSDVDQSSVARRNRVGVLAGASAEHADVTALHRQVEVLLLRLFFGRHFLLHDRVAEFVLHRRFAFEFLRGFREKIFKVELPTLQLVVNRQLAANFINLHFQVVVDAARRRRVVFKLFVITN